MGFAGRLKCGEGNSEESWSVWLCFPRDYNNGLGQGVGSGGVRKGMNLCQERQQDCWAAQAVLEGHSWGLPGHAIAKKSDFSLYRISHKC